MIVNIKRLNEGAIVPTKGSEYAAGLDLYAITNTTEKEVCISPGGTVMIGTGIAAEIPNGFFGGIFARSGLASKRGLRPANCVAVIDSDYRGELIVALHNDSDEYATIKDGDRIAQLVIMPYLDVQLNEVCELSDTSRGDGGFGSTGVSQTQEYEQLSLFDVM